MGKKVYKAKYSGKVYNTAHKAAVDNANYLRARNLTEQTNRIPATYIGGNTQQARNAYWQQEPVLQHAVDSIAGRYGIDSAGLKYRLNNEGYIDQQIRLRNNPDLFVSERGYALLNGDNGAGGAEHFGLDDVATLIEQGKVKPINEQWWDIDFTNEKGRQTHGAQGSTVADNIGLVAATLKYFRNKAKEDFPNASEEDLNRYAQAYYNRGEVGGKKWVESGAKGYNYKAYGGPKDSPWNSLSMADKAAMMEVAIKNGITTLPEIRKAYNEFAEGGNIYSEENKLQQDVNIYPGGGWLGMMPAMPSTALSGGVDAIRKRLYENITPFGYHDPISRAFNAVAKNQQDDTRADENKKIKKSDPQASALDAIWATYLNIPENQRRKINSRYGISKTKDGYYRFNNPGMIFDFERDLSSEGLYSLPGRKAVMMSGILGNYTTGLARDKKGDYMFYSDSRLNPNGTPNIKTGWDINPYSNTVDNDTEETTESHGQYGQDKKSISYKIGKALFGSISDLSMGIGKPVPIYDKIYLDDYYEVPNAYKGGIYLPEVTVIGKRKKKALGGNLYPDGGYVRSTNDHPVAFDSEGNLVDQVTGETGTMMFPEILLTADPDDVARGRAQRWYKDFGTESNDATSFADGRRQNSHLDGRSRSIPWDANPVLNTIGLGLSAVPFAVAAYPGAVVGGELLGTALANPYVDAGLTSVFAAHGLNHAINEGITDWKDGVMTALEVTPLGRLARPLYNAGKEGLQYAAKAADNTARYISPSYDLYRTVEETTPKIGNRFISTNGEGTYDLFDQFGLPIGEATTTAGSREGTKGILWVDSKNNAHKVTEDIYNTIVGDTKDALEKGLESGWDLFSPDKTLAATSKFPYVVIGQSNGHDVRLLMGQTSRNIPQKISGNHWYEIKPQTETKLEYNSLTGDYEKVPVNNEVIADNIATIEWTNAARTPQITAENAASITPEQWTTAQDAAIARGDMVEAQRLSDLHSDIAAEREGFTVYNTYRSQKPNNKYKWENKSPYDDSRYGIGKSSGYFSTDSEPVARTYKYTDDSPLFNLNVYMKDPYIKDVEGRSWQFADTRIAPNGIKYGVTTDEIINKIKPEGVYDGVIFKNIVDVGAFRRNLNGASDVATDYVSFPGRAKLRDAVTYDDNGVRIPLGDRHNFNINDIRYGLLPFLGLGTASTLYMSSGNENAYGGNLFGDGSYMEQAKALIRNNEGWRATPYKDAPKGVSWRSVGYGFNDSGFREKYPEGISKHYEHGITRAQAEQELDYYLTRAEKQLKGIYGKKWDSFTDGQKAAILDTYYQRPASVANKSAFYNAVMSGKDPSKYLGVVGFDKRNNMRRNTFLGGFSGSYDIPQDAYTIQQYNDVPTTLFAPSNPEVFFGGYKAPEIEAPLPSVELEDTPQYSEEEIARQERRERLNNLSMLMNLTSPQGSSNSMLDALGLLMR